MIKALEEDFVVEERTEIPFHKDGEFGVYSLKKKGWNTLDLINHIAKSFKISFSSISYGGKKDKHGITSQFITIKGRKDFSMEGKDFSLKLIGFSNRPMSPDLIISNYFKIVLRNIKNLEGILCNIEEIKKFGVPNFFDDQRFRSYDPVRGFFAEKILKKQWNGALQVFLTSIYPDMEGDEKRRRMEIFKNWKDWNKCFEIAETKIEKKIFKILKDENDFVKALHLIPKEEVSMLYSSYQSRLWNEILRRLIKIKVEEIYEIKGFEGSYLFWKTLDMETFSYLKNLKIPTPSHRIEFQDAFVEGIYNEILREMGLKKNSFRTSILRKVYFRTFPRKALIIPEDFRVIEEGDDELNRGKKKIRVEFYLPRGSYATMVIKRTEAKWIKD